MKFSIHSIITNKYILYIISFLSLLQLFTYIYQNQLDSIIVFMLISYIVYTFTNNMTLIFLIPLVILRITSWFKIEGFETDNPGDTTETQSTDMNTDVDNSTNSKKKDDNKSKSSSSTTNNDNIIPDFESPPISEPTVDAFSKNRKGGSLTKIENYDNSNLNASMSIYNTNNPETIPPNNKSTTNKSRNKDSSDLYESSNDPNKINYATTLHSNLKYYNDVLGSDGISKMTEHTKELLEQQAQLGKSIAQFAPLMDQIGPFITNATNALDKLTPKKQ